MVESYKGKAIVSYAPLADGGWKFEDISTTTDLQDDELVVEMVGSGVCHTDILLGSMPEGHPLGVWPRVLGHEGSAYVRHVGKKVTSVAVGDPVLLSYAYCNSCRICKAGHLTYCEQFAPLNFIGRPTFKDASGSKDIFGSCFGQSSFASYSVVRESSVVNVKGVVTDKKELALFSPLGCGIQTGAGTVVEAAKTGEDDAAVVTGLGGVGLSAILGAKICGAKIIVGVDIVQSRLNVAKELGATHVINSKNLPEGKSLVDTLKEICHGIGPSVAVETTGVPTLIENCIEATRPRGQILQVGSAPPDFNLQIPAFAHMIAGKVYRGVIEGEVKPVDFIPKMIQWYRDGRFPIDKLVKFVDAKDFGQALHDMHTGETIKPVLLW